MRLTALVMFIEVEVDTVTPLVALDVSVDDSLQKSVSPASVGRDPNGEIAPLLLRAVRCY